MRLLNTRTRQFKEFYNPPAYGILSHRWSDDNEVSYEDCCYVLERNQGALREWETARVDAIVRRSGYAKIYRCCTFAEQRGHAWVWIDTCCIDKRSSAELSEAINSMWN